MLFSLSPGAQLLLSVAAALAVAGLVLLLKVRQSLLWLPCSNWGFPAGPTCRLGVAASSG